MIFFWQVSEKTSWSGFLHFNKRWSVYTFYSKDKELE